MIKHILKLILVLLKYIFTNLYTLIWDYENGYYSIKKAKTDTFSFLAMVAETHPKDFDID